MTYEIVLLREQPGWLEPAAGWFAEKWGIPVEAYRESMHQCVNGNAPVPQWYLAVENGEILGGLGVIENDFHNRKDLRPNVCAVYTMPQARGRGIARALLDTACRDQQAQGNATLYLLTDHQHFYERCGWQFYDMVLGDGDDQPARMYVHRMP